MITIDLMGGLGNQLFQIFTVLAYSYENNKEIVFYDSAKDLAEKINKYNTNDKERIKIAKAGKKKYFKYFNSTIVAEFILSKTLGYKSKSKFIWDNE